MASLRSDGERLRSANKRTTIHIANRVEHRHPDSNEALWTRMLKRSLISIFLTIP